MIKLCWWLFRTFIWGNDFKIDFNFSVDFEEAMIYLKKDILYINSEIQIRYL